MNPFTKIAASVVLAATCAFAGAETVDLSFTGIVGGGGADRARIGSSTFLAGHLTHDITSGPRAGTSFNTFCIEVEEYAQTGSATYEIVDLADAPNPGSLYGQAKANKVSAIIANAHAMGWIDSHLQADSGGADYLGRMGAIQAAVWEALGHSFDVNHSSTSASLRTQYNLLTNNGTFVGTFDDSLRMAGLRAAVAIGQQDQLYIVALPSGALAGLGLLGGIAGVRIVRRR